MDYKAMSGLCAECFGQLEGDADEADEVSYALCILLEGREPSVAARALLRALESMPEALKHVELHQALAKETRGRA